MHHKTLQQLEPVAALYPERTRARLSQHERLSRWAAMLERAPERRVTALSGTEYQLPAERDAMRCDNSPLTVAWEDPVLRDQGLAGDRFEDAKAFFGLSNRQLHDLVCHCLNGETVSTQLIARRVRILASRLAPGPLGRLWQSLTSRWLDR